MVRSTGYGGTVDVRILLKPEEIELYFQNRSADAAQAAHVRPALVAREMGTDLVGRRSLLS